jgi:hypothetical protein
MPPADELQRRLGLKGVNNAKRLEQGSSEAAKAKLRSMRTSLPLGGNTTDKLTQGRRGKNTGVSIDETRSGSTSDSSGAQQRALEGAGTNRTKQGRNSQAKELNAAEKTEQVRAMRQRLKTKVADFTARSTQRMDGASALTAKPATPNSSQQMAQAAVRHKELAPEEPANTKTAQKISTIVGDAAGSAMETVDGATSTLRTAPVATAEAPAPVAERIVQHIERVMAQSQRQMTISMGELGEVRISMQRLAMQNGGLQVVLEATDARTSQLLQGQLGQLNEALQQRGYGDAVVDVREADADSAGFNENQEDHHREDASEEEERREAELAARQRMKDSGRKNGRKGVVR